MLDTHIPMFPGYLTELDSNQLSLIFWLKFYNQHVFSLDSLERPADYIVDYDILLDEYIEQKEFREKSKNTGRDRASANEMQSVIEF